MEARAQVEDTFYILATQSTGDCATRVLKDNDTSAVFDRHGDIQADVLVKKAFITKTRGFFLIYFSN